MQIMHSFFFSMSLTHLKLMSCVDFSMPRAGTSKYKLEKYIITNEEDDNQAPILHGS